MPTSTELAAGPDAGLDATLGALADPTRRALLERLGEGEVRVTDLAAPFDLSLNAVSKHLRVLEAAGLVRRRRAGREHWLSLERTPLAAAATWIEQRRNLWSSRQEELEALLEAEQAEPPGGFR